MTPKLAIAAALLVLPGLAAAQKLSQLPEEKQAVEAALTARGIAGAKRLLVADRTTTFSCNLTRDDLVQVEGCSGMSQRGEPLDQVMARLKRSLGASDETLADFRAKAARSAIVDKPFELPVSQIVWGPGRGVKRFQLAQPDYSVAVSRVGFDKAKTQAMLYVATISGGDPKGSFGEYVLLDRAGGGGWKVAKRFRVWQLSPG